MRVAIVGSGIAGLAAAHALAAPRRDGVRGRGARRAATSTRSTPTGTRSTSASSCTTASAIRSSARCSTSSASRRAPTTMSFSVSRRRARVGQRVAVGAVRRSPPRCSTAPLAVPRRGARVRRARAPRSRQRAGRARVARRVPRGAARAARRARAVRRAARRRAVVARAGALRRVPGRDLPRLPRSPRHAAAGAAAARGARSSAAAGATSTRSSRARAAFALALATPVAAIDRDRRGVTRGRRRPRAPLRSRRSSRRTPTPRSRCSPRRPTAERRVLGAFRYSRNRTVLHTDRAFLPRAPAAHASWNYVADPDTSRVAVTYSMTRLQGLPDAPYLVTLNPRREPAGDPPRDHVRSPAARSRRARRAGRAAAPRRHAPHVLRRRALRLRLSRGRHARRARRRGRASAADAGTAA